MTVTGGVDTTVLVNAAFCESLPCNNGAVQYHFGDVPIRAAETYEGPIATGVHPQNDSGLYYPPTPFGCDGNDLEMICAPAVPSAIASLTGRIVDGVFLVDAYELVPGAPTTETLEAPPGYAAITLRTASE